MLTEVISPYFRMDALAEIMIGLVAFIGTLVWLFAKRYLEGDRQYRRFSWQLIALCLSVMGLLAADNILVFFSAWCLSNTLLVSLMVHKAEWSAARASGRLAGKTFALGALFLSLAFGILYYMTGATSIQAIIQSPAHLADETLLLTIALGFMLIAAMTQSAIWPCHRWLLSSLNSPTPVSAIMHAGLINGGGFLLARFAPLYLIEQNLLLAIFFIGLITAILGTLWKLIQHDIKRMLACSTMAQMGFMLAQCGLGLFPAAVAHLCWHGLFKATLFLGAGAAAQDKRLLVKDPPTLVVVFSALLSGLLGSYCFALTSGKDWFALDTSSVLVGVAFITTAQLALTLLQTDLWKNIFIVAGLSSAAGACYGWSVFIITRWLAPLQISQPQPLSALYVVGFALLAGCWLATVFRGLWLKSAGVKNLLKPSYVRLLNATLPDPTTITAHRNDYQY